MGAVLKRTIAAGLGLIILMCMATASASTGSIDNPLITLSYLDGAFAGSMKADISDALEESVSAAVSKLDDLYRSSVGYSFAPRFTNVSLGQGGTIALSPGGSIILLSGSATIAITGGEVINVSTGDEVVSAQPLTLYQRYFCTENTTAVVTAGAPATAQVDGYYMLDAQSAPVTPQEPTTPRPQSAFIDVAESDWFYAAVDYVYRNGLFAGTTATTFSPGTAMTRGMFVTVLHRLDGRPAVDFGAGLSDVTNPAMYYYDAVIWANANRIVTGYTDGTFQPDRAVSREEMAVIIHRYASHKGRDMQPRGAGPEQGVQFDAFQDRGDVSAYAAPAMQWAVSWEIIRGSNGRLLPRNTATRAEVAQIIYNYCEKVG